MRKNADIKTFTLIVWEEVPETTRFALIPNEILTRDDLSVLRLAHGHYINNENEGDEDEALDAISNALTDDETCLGENHPKGSKWAMRFAQYLLDGEKPIEDKTITRVYVMGFVL